MPSIRVVLGFLPLLAVFPFYSLCYRIGTVLSGYIGAHVTLSRPDPVENLVPVLLAGQVHVLLGRVILLLLILGVSVCKYINC